MVLKTINIVGGVDTIVKVAARNFTAQYKLFFAQVVSNNTYFTFPDFLQPCIKGDSISIEIPEDEYTKGVEECKSILHGRSIVKKGEKPHTVKQLQKTLIPLWKINSWKLVMLDKGFFEFVFSTIKEMPPFGRRVLGILNLESFAFLVTMGFRFLPRLLEII